MLQSMTTFDMSFNFYPFLQPHITEEDLEDLESPEKKNPVQEIPRQPTPETDTLPRQPTTDIISYLMRRVCITYSKRIVAPASKF